MVRIPINLQKPEFRFCKIRKQSKAPFEKNWTEGYRFDDPELLNWIREGNNYGVIGGPGNLRILDIDNKELAEKFAKEVDTFTIKTGSGGMHFYFISDYDTNHVLVNEQGELRAKNYQVVGASSIHPNGNKYEIINNTKIVELVPEFMEKLIKPYLREEHQVEPVPHEKSKDTSRSGFEFGQLCQLIKKKLTKETIFFEMNKYSKWASAPVQYRETSYKKALAEIAQKQKEKSEKKALEIFTRRGQAKQFIEEQPIYYDNAGIWWIWNKDDFKWEMSDDVDILNKIHLNLQIDTISSKAKSEILTSLKQEGRLNKPKETKKTWIQFKSKIFDFSTGEEFEATPAYLVTNPLPFEIGESEDTPTINELFEEWVGLEYTQTLFEILAYACSSDQSLQTIIALTGSGSNGKGTFLQLLTNFIGKENVCSSELKTLALRNFETSALYKRLVCQMGEVDAYDLKNTNLIKQLTGEDLIRYEFKGKNPFSDYSSTTCIIATNSLPVTPDRSIGFYRRWLVVDFPNQFKVIRNILGKIPKEEYHNLAKKILNILKNLYERGAFTNGGTFDERMQRYEERSNPIQKFIEEKCEDEPTEKIKLQEFSKKLNEYLKTKHLRLMSVRQIGKALREEGYEVGTRAYTEGEIKTSAKVVLNLKLSENEL